MEERERPIDVVITGAIITGAIAEDVPEYLALALQPLLQEQLFVISTVATTKAY